jgi:hypothetical protein
MADWRQHKELLRRASSADEKAERASGEQTRASWKMIAAGYRHLARIVADI